MIRPEDSRQNAVPHRLKTMSPLALLLLVLGACGGAAPPPIPHVDMQGLPQAVSAQLNHSLQQSAAAPIGSEQFAAVNGTLAMQLHVYGFLPQALVCYERALSASPDAFDWHYMRADVLARLGHAAQAQAGFADALARAPENLDARLRIAQLQLDAGDAAAALATLGKVSHEQYSAASTQFLLGRARQMSGDYKAASEHLRNALARRGAFGAGHYALASVYRALGEDALAREQLSEFERARNVKLLLDPRMRAQLSAMVASDRRDVLEATSHAGKGEIDKAIAAYLRAAATDPDNANTHASLVGLYALAGDVAKAEEHFQRATELTRALPRAYANMGLAFARSGQREAAAQRYRDAVQLEPHDPQLSASYARVLEQAGQSEAAIAEHHRMLSNEPAAGTARLALIRLHGEMGHDDQVQTLLAQARALADASTVPALRQAATQARAAGDVAAAVALLEEAGAMASARGEHANVAAVNSELLRIQAGQQ